MCIRDSTTLYTTEQIENATQMATIGQVPASKDDLAIARLCLLYTSDAADERSSVDLGGRRIIKKKTKSDMESIYEII